MSNAVFIFDSLTTTKSVTTPTASKAGLFLELQYDTSTTLHPGLIGGKLLDHRLERSRVTAVPTGERNFHILYYLLAGTSPSEKSHLGLDIPGGFSDGASNRISGGVKRWRFLGHPTQMKVGIDDAEGFTQFKKALRRLEFPNSEIGQICQILAVILHLGQLEFVTTKSTTPAPGESGGYSHEGGEDVTVVRNKENLEIIANFLGVQTQNLELSFGYKTKTLHRERVTVVLDPNGARNAADELARTLYALIVAYIMEKVNDKLCALEDSIANTVSIVDFPGFAPLPSTGQVLDQLLNNTAAESLYHSCLVNFFERMGDMLDTEEVAVTPTSYFDNSDAVKGLLKPGNGLLAILDDQSKKGRSDVQFLESIKKRFAKKNPAITVGESTTIMPGSNFATHNAAAKFSVKHYAGEVDYPIEGLMEANAEVISGDMLNLINSTESDFVRMLFGQEALKKVVHPKEKSAVVQASVASKPSRMPSMARRKHDRLARFPPTTSNTFEDDVLSEVDSRTSSFVRGTKGGNELGQQQGVAAQFLSSLSNITRTLNTHDTNTYFVFCLKPNERRIANQFDSKCVRAQVQTFGIVETSQRLANADFSIFLPFNDFLAFTLPESDNVFLGSDQEKVATMIREKGAEWPTNELKAGLTGVFLSERLWLEIARIPNVPMQPAPRYTADVENEGDAFGGPTPYGESKQHLLSSTSPTPGYYNDDKTGAYFGARDIDGKSDAGVSAINGGDMFRNLETREQLAEKTKGKKEEVIEEHPMSSSRRNWLFLVYLLTFYFPDFLIKWVQRQPRKDVRMAWREKLAINYLIWLSCAAMVFLTVGFPALICPRQDVFSPAELTSHDGKNGHSSYVSIRGIVYDLDSFMPRHYPNVVPQSSLKKYAGKDATGLFPIQVSAICNGKDGSVDPAITLNYQSTNYSSITVNTAGQDINARYHDFRSFTNDSRPDWWWEQQYMLKKQYKVGYVGYKPQSLRSLAQKQNAIALLHGKIYDMTAYIAGGRITQYPPGTDPPSDRPDTNFMDDTVVQLIQNGAGEDVSKYWDNLAIDPALKVRMKVCLDNLFYVGNVDTRGSTQCLFAKYLLLAISILLVSVIGFKFLAALQFGKKNVPEDLEKFIICTIPAYTEDEDSLRRAIDSAARMRYDDKRKLLFIVCDGMIIGQGNDRPTPRIVLDILGVSETVDPESLSFESLGEGQKQHNMGKVYSGLYEVQGHIVPFVVVVKVGKPSEVQK